MKRLVVLGALGVFLLLASGCATPESGLVYVGGASARASLSGVAAGDSNTLGNNPEVPPGSRTYACSYPIQSGPNFFGQCRSSWANWLGMKNWAVGGSAFTTGATTKATIPATILARIAAEGAPSRLIISGATNDLMSGVKSPAIISAMKALSDRLAVVAPQTKVYWLTVFPASERIGGPAAEANGRPLINSWLLSASGKPELHNQRVIDCNAMITDPAKPQYLKPALTFIDGSGVHLSSTAGALVSDCVSAVVRAVEPTA